MINQNFKFSNIQWSKVGDLIIPLSMEQFSNPGNNLRTIQKSLSLSDITGSKMTIDEIIQNLGRLPLLFWINFVSSISTFLAIKGQNNFELQRSLALDYSTGKYQEIIINKVENERYYLFIPITLASLIKLSLSYSPSEDIKFDEDPIFLATTTYLGLNDHVNNSVKNLIDTDPELALKKYFIQNSIFGSPFNLQERALRIWKLLYHYPTLVSPDNLPNDIFIEKRNIDIELYLSISICIFLFNNQIDFNSSESISMYLPIKLDYTFSPTVLSETQITDFFNGLIIDETKLEELKQQDVNSDFYFYDFSALKQNPIYKIREGLYIPLFYPFFAQRITENVYWEIFDYMKENPSYNHQNFATKFGKYLERYIQDIYKSLYSDSDVLSKRIWIEPKINSNDPSPDILIYYPDAYIFIEIKASRFKYENTLVKGKDEAIDDDLRKMVCEPVEQISKSINFFKSGGLSELGLQYKGETIYPIIITYDSLPTVEIFGPLIKQLLKEKGLDATLVDTLLHIDIEEAFSLASLVSKNIPMIDIVRRKNSPEFKDIPFINFIKDVYGDDSSSSIILKEDFENFSLIIQNRLKNTG